jgi:hypothetical protein
MAPTPGQAQFARYAYPPNDLGHCGPPGAAALLAGGAVGGGHSGDGPELRARLARFEGAWPYLRLLARTAGVPDALHPDVVAAYWLGGELLDAVEPASLLAAVDRGFGAQPGVRERLAQLAGGAVAADHAFHVFVVYPWVGLLGRAGDVPRSVLDSCRVRWGTVASVDGESAGVRSRPLTWDGARLGLGPAELVHCRWARDGRSFVAGLRPGDQVSLHWNWICERLDDAQVTALSGRTDRQLELTNEWLSDQSTP